MTLKEELPGLVGKLSKIIGRELAEKIVKVACETTTDEAEAIIVEGLSALTFEQRSKTIAMLDAYIH